MYFYPSLKLLLYSPRELIEDKPKVKCWSSFFGYPQVVSHVYVHEAEGLQNQDSQGGEVLKQLLQFFSHHQIRVINTQSWFAEMVLFIFFTQVQTPM